MSGSLLGKRILIVEDEYYIATDIKRTLAQAGAIVIGPVGNLDAALKLAEEPVDAAILDVNLEKALSYPVAERMRSRNVPYMFLTGYDGWSLPAAYREVARLTKPFPSGSVVAMVEQLLAPGQEG